MNRERYIDLHTHTTASDGTLSPANLVAEAVWCGLSAVAITDHDNVNGIEEALDAAKNYDIEVISGIELAAYYYAPQKTEIHIVGLFVDYKNPFLLANINELLKQRVERNIKMTKRLTELGFPITYEELFAEAGNDGFSRVHYANVMVKKGYVETKNKAFTSLIGSGKPGYVPRTLPTPKECIDLIRKSGGIAVLAHPTLYGMNYTQITTMAKELKALGLTAIETKYSTYKPEQEREITKIAALLNLMPSGGSDFHGDNKPDISLGVGRGNLKIPYEYLNNLRPKP